MGAQNTIGGSRLSVAREGGAPVLPEIAGETISLTYRQSRRAPRHVALGNQSWLYMRPFNGDAINRQPRRRWLFRRSAPVRGFWRSEIPGPRCFPSPAPLALSSIATSPGSSAPRNSGAALLPIPGARIVSATLAPVPGMGRPPPPGPGARVTVLTREPVPWSGPD